MRWPLRCRVVWGAGGAAADRSGHGCCSPPSAVAGSALTAVGSKPPIEVGCWQQRAVDYHRPRCCGCTSSSCQQTMRPPALRSSRTRRVGRCPLRRRPRRPDRPSQPQRGGAGPAQSAKAPTTGARAVRSAREVAAPRESSPPWHSAGDSPKPPAPQSQRPTPSFRHSSQLLGQRVRPASPGAVLGPRALSQVALYPRSHGRLCASRTCRPMLPPPPPRCAVWSTAP